MLDSLIESAQAAEQVGAWEEALTCYETAFAQVVERGATRETAEVLRKIGQVHYARGDLEQADELFQTSLSIAELNGLEHQVAPALNCLAVISQYSGNGERAEALYARASELARESGDERLAAVVHQNLGTLANVRGELDAARRHHRLAQELFARLGDEQGAARVLNNLGMLQVDAGEWKAAEASFDEAFRLADRLRDLSTLGTVEVNRAELHLRRRSFPQMRECCDRAYEIYSRLDSKLGVGETHKFYGVLYRETGKPYLAEMHLTLALELARSGGDRLLEAEVESERAHLALASSQFREALRCLNHAHQLFEELGAAREAYGTERRLQRLEESYLEVARQWGESVERRNPHMVGHHARVAGLACRLGESVGIAGRDLTWLRVGALLHDVGELEVPAELLGKPGALSPEERRQAQEHTVSGDRIVAELDFPRDIRAMVRGHHERWDGSGYPDGLRGEEIPLAARILTVADVFAALTSARSHRPALPRPEALRVMRQEAGRVLDPRLYAVFRGLLEEES